MKIIYHAYKQRFRRSEDDRKFRADKYARHYNAEHIKQKAHLNVHTISNRQIYRQYTINDNKNVSGNINIALSRKYIQTHQQ